MSKASGIVIINNFYVMCIVGEEKRTTLEISKMCIVKPTINNFYTANQMPKRKYRLFYHIELKNKRTCIVYANKMVLKL